MLTVLLQTKSTTYSSGGRSCFCAAQRPRSQFAIVSAGRSGITVENSGYPRVDVLSVSAREQRQRRHRLRASPERGAGWSVA